MVLIEWLARCGFGDWEAATDQPSLRLYVARERRAGIVKHKTAVIFLSVVVAGAMLNAFARSSHQRSTGVMLSLVGYTNDTWLHSAMYRESSTTNTRIAIFAVSNQTSWHTFLYGRGQLQLKTARGWQEDENTWVGRDEITEPLRPKHLTKIDFPVPEGGATWRCSVRVFDITCSPHGRPNWLAWILTRIRRAGVNLEPSYTVWSTEIPK